MHGYWTYLYMVQNWIGSEEIWSKKFHANLVNKLSYTLDATIVLR